MREEEYIERIQEKYFEEKSLHERLYYDGKIFLQIISWIVSCVFVYFSSIQMFLFFSGYVKHNNKHLVGAMVFSYYLFPAIWGVVIIIFFDRRQLNARETVSFTAWLTRIKIRMLTFTLTITSCIIVYFIILYCLEYSLLFR